MKILLVFSIIPQALRHGGLDSLAEDPKFVSVTRKELSEATHIGLEDMEGLAKGILHGQTPKAPKRRRRPIPVPPNAKPKEDTTAV